MNFGTYPKQPVEVIDYDLDYREWLTPGDKVQSAAVTVSPPDELTVDSVFINDPRVKLWLSAGEHNTQYKITVTLTTADGRVRQDEFKIRVRDL